MLHYNNQLMYNYITRHISFKFLLESQQNITDRVVDKLILYEQGFCFQRVTYFGI